MQPNLYNKIRDAYKLNDSTNLKILSKNLIRNLNLSKELRQKAYYHPLGFIYSTLYLFKNKETIRIHIWDKKKCYQYPRMDIHDHYYTVNSYVMAGSIQNNIFKSENGTTKYSLYKGEYAENGNRILRKTAGTITVKLNYSETIHAGSLYRIDIGQLHSSSVENDSFTCTLVYTENPGIPNPLVLGPIDGDSKYLYSKAAVESNVIDNILNKLDL